MEPPDNEADCLRRYAHVEGWCPAAWDSLFCWPPAVAASTASFPCSTIFPFLRTTDATAAVAFRLCGEDEQWSRDGWTNYSECERLDIQVSSSEGSISAITLSVVLFVGSLLSLASLCVAQAVFSCFRSLQCSRIRVHRNLVSALILHTILMLVVASAGLWAAPARLLAHTALLCQSVLALKTYSGMCSVYWMFVEGLLLHSSIAVSVFQRNQPFLLYYVTGWGVPLVFVGAWVLTMELQWRGSACWEGYGRSPLVWMVTGPMILALIVNAVFLVNIIRILITKMRSNVAIETKQVRRAMKATALLFPLLGLTHLLFCINPGGDWEPLYMLVNALLQSSQGFFVAVLYCFFNSEVQSAVCAAYTRRNTVRRGGRRHRSSRMLTSITNTLPHEPPQREILETPFNEMDKPSCPEHKLQIKLPVS